MQNGGRELSKRFIFGQFYSYLLLLKMMRRRVATFGQCPKLAAAGEVTLKFLRAEGGGVRKGG